MRVYHYKEFGLHIDLDSVSIISDILYERKVINHVYHYVLSFNMYMKHHDVPFNIQYELVSGRDYRFADDDAGILIPKYENGEEVWTFVRHPSDPIKLERGFVPVMKLQHELN